MVEASRGLNTSVDVDDPSSKTPREKELHAKVGSLISRERLLLHAAYHRPSFSSVPGCERSLHKLREYYKVRGWHGAMVEIFHPFVVVN